MPFFLSLAVATISLAFSGSSVQAQRHRLPDIESPNYRVSPIPPVRPEMAPSDSDELFERLAPWVFVEFRMSHGIAWGRFLNASDKRKTVWLRPGDSFEGARIIALNSDRASVAFGAARQDLLFVPEKAPKYDPNRRQTPEEIVAAQRRYSEFYRKRFIVSGKEYARQRGNLSAPQNQWYPKP